MERAGRGQSRACLHGDVGRPNDMGIFCYNIESGERKFLTALKTVSQAEDNLLSGENIIKGHMRIVEMNGKMYIGSQGFHDVFEIDPTVHGGHLYQMDVATEQWYDLSATDPNWRFDSASGCHRGGCYP